MPYFGRLYEVEVTPRGAERASIRRRTRGPVNLLEPILGIGDAWACVHEADLQWAAGNEGWAVEYEEAPGT